MNLFELNINNMIIAGKTWGSPENPPILALHGWLDNANSFDLLAAELASSYFFIAIDLPGHGLSSHLPPYCNYHFTDGIFTVVQIIKALQLDQVHLLGHSMGACLASLVAGVAPTLCLSVSLIEGLGPFSHPGDTACTQLSDYLQYLLKGQIKKAKGYKNIESAALARAHKGYVSLEIARLLCERGLYKEENHYYWRHDKKLLVPSPLRMTEQQVLSCLKNIEANTCLLWASKGFSFNSDLIQGRLKAVKHLEVKHIDGGHHIHMEDPKAITTALINFYDSI